MDFQVSPWMLIADKQRRMSILRDEEERELRKQLKSKYQKELADQLEQKRKARIEKEQEQREEEKRLIQQSLEQQKKMKQFSHLKSLAMNEKQLRLDMENQMFKAARKNREDFVEKQSQKIESLLNEEALTRHQEEMEEQGRKKKQLLKHLQESIDIKNRYDRYVKEKEIEEERKKSVENEAMNKQSEKNRNDYLRSLKQKAATIDYGSHQIVSKNHEKTLMERKKEQWQSQREYLERASKANQSDRDYKTSKQMQEKQFRNELKKQLEQRRMQEKIRAQQQVQEDFEKIQHYQQYSHSVDLERKKHELNRRDQLRDYLRKQIQEKQIWKKREPFVMRDRDLAMNSDVLRGERVTIPGESYQLDRERKRQLEYVTKSMTNSPIKDQSRKYLAERGRSLLV